MYMQLYVYYYYSHKREVLYYHYSNKREVLYYNNSNKSEVPLPLLYLNINPIVPQELTILPL